MKRGTWCTKEDVLKDLSLATGRTVADIGDEFFLVGEQPPPPRVVGDEDDEIELRFGRAAAAQSQCDAPGSDLKGITKMLRMVDYCENSDEKTSIDTKPKRGSKNIISKLNPNVKEFIPKCVQNSPSENVTKCEDIETTNVSIDIVVNSGSNIEKLDTKTNVEKNTKFDLSEAKDQSKDAIKELAVMLKNQISSKRHTFEEQRQTNLAIVNLLKLYVKPDPKDTVKPLKLYTPEFFENCKSSEYECNDESTIVHDVDVKNIDTSNKQSQNLLEDKSKDDDENAVTSEFLTKVNCKSDNSIQNKRIIEVDDLNEATSLTPDMADTSINDNKVIPTTVDEPVDREVAKSISKVSNWLDNKPYITICEKEKPKGPALYLGTVAYKRKDPVTCKSPSEIADKKISKPSDSSYQPSNYADELLQKYKNMSKKMAPTLNIWEKLEEDLKKKDKEIKNRKSKS